MTRIADHLFAIPICHQSGSTRLCTIFNIFKGGAEKCFPSACRNESNLKHVVPLRSDTTT